MTQEEKDLLLKDLCGRLPYKPQVEIIKDGTSVTDKLTTATINYLEDGYWDVKPYLFPLSSMTEEQRKEMEENCLKFPQSGVLMPTYKTFDFFNKHHIDFRGLIEQGLANDATGLNIY